MVMGIVIALPAHTQEIQRLLHEARENRVASPQTAEILGSVTLHFLSSSTQNTKSRDPKNLQPLSNPLTEREREREREREGGLQTHSKEHPSRVYPTKLEQTHLNLQSLPSPCSLGNNATHLARGGDASFGRVCSSYSYVSGGGFMDLCCVVQSGSGDATVFTDHTSTLHSSHLDESLTANLAHCQCRSECAEIAQFLRLRL